MWYKLLQVCLYNLPHVYYFNADTGGQVKTSVWKFWRLNLDK